MSERRLVYLASRVLLTIKFVRVATTGSVRKSIRASISTHHATASEVGRIYRIFFQWPKISWHIVYLWFACRVSRLGLYRWFQCNTRLRPCHYNASTDPEQYFLYTCHIHSRETTDVYPCFGLLYHDGIVHSVSRLWPRSLWILFNSLPGAQRSCAPEAFDSNCINASALINSNCNMYFGWFAGSPVLWLFLFNTCLLGYSYRTCQKQAEIRCPAVHVGCHSDCNRSGIQPNGPLSLRCSFLFGDWDSYSRLDLQEYSEQTTVDSVSISSSAFLSGSFARRCGTDSVCVCGDRR